MNNEREFQRYQEYLAHKRQNIAPDLGHMATGILLSPFTFSIIEPGVANKAENIDTYESSTLAPAYQVELGALTARTLINIDRTPRQALSKLSKNNVSLAA